MDNLSARLLNYRHTHFNEKGKHLSQANMVQLFSRYGSISLETYIKWERGLGQPDESNLPIIEKILSEN